VKNDQGTVKVFRNFQEHKSFKTGFANEGIFGGRLLGIKGKDFVTFYDWEEFNVVRRIDVGAQIKNVYWSEGGQTIVLALEDSFYLLAYNSDLVDQTFKEAAMGRATIDEDGIEDAFSMIEEFSETVTSGVWIGSESFVFTSTKGAISYTIGSKVVKLSNCDKKYFALGYEGKQNRLYLVDKSLNVVSY